MVIEDARAGIMAARRAGMRVIGLAASGQARDLSGADAIVRSCADIAVERVRSCGSRRGGLVLHVGPDRFGGTPHRRGEWLLQERAQYGGRHVALISLSRPWRSGHCRAIGSWC